MKNKLACAAFLLTTLGRLSAPAEAAPWSLHDSAHLPEWLSVSISHRTRYENIDDTYKNRLNGGDQVLAFRTQAFLEAAFNEFRFGAEFIDSRIDLEDAATPVNTTLVNETELLQAYVAWQSMDVLGSGLDVEVKFGRQTMDLGSRRLVARNRFRNTLNNFNGLDVVVKRGNHWQWRNFAVLPVSPLPNDQASLRNGASEFDEENFNVIFAGSFFSIGDLPLDTTAELYFLQLSENDTAGTPSRNRQLSTPGLRWFRAAKPERLDFELETALQTGTSRAGTSAADTADLDHFAYFGHAAFGYSFALPWSPRLLLQYDYASGDDDPNDGTSGRFETLYGARRFEFGPTGIWGAFARANINTPGIRVEFKPTPDLDGFIAHRAFWLAAKRDAWTGAGLRDSSGQSGSFIGQQLEARLRWFVVPKAISLETGWAHLFKGRFAKEAPGSPTDKSDSDYFYAQTVLTF
ncbi:MAG: alginate export family protein [Gammaproteobacteria bacterium]